MAGDDFTLVVVDETGSTWGLDDVVAAIIGVSPGRWGCCNQDVPN